MAIKRTMTIEGTKLHWPKDPNENVYVDVAGNILVNSENYLYGPNFANLYPKALTRKGLYDNWLVDNFDKLKSEMDNGISIPRYILMGLYRNRTNDLIKKELDEVDISDFEVGKYTVDQRTFTVTFEDPSLSLIGNAVEVKHVVKRGAETSNWQVTRNLTVPSPWRSLKNYTYRVSDEEHNFFRTLHKSNDELYFGLELEINTRMTANELQCIVKDVEPKQDLFFVCKSDASIQGRYNRCLELVTVPCTPGYLKKNFRILFKKIEALANKGGGTTSDYIEMSNTEANGLHIHVSKNAFFYKYHMNRFVLLFNSWGTKNKDFIALLSGREGYWNNQYCSPDRIFRGIRPTFAIKEGSGRDGLGDRNRHSVCHTIPASTVEVRVFAGIPTQEHVSSCIEATEAIFNFTRFNSVKSVSTGFVPIFKEWLGKQPRSKYRNLTKRLSKCA